MLNGACGGIFGPHGCRFTYPSDPESPIFWCLFHFETGEFVCDRKSPRISRPPVPLLSSHFSSTFPFSLLFSNYFVVRSNLVIPLKDRVSRLQGLFPVWRRFAPSVEKVADLSHSRYLLSIAGLLFSFPQVTIYEALLQSVFACWSSSHGALWRWASPHPCIWVFILEAWE